MKKTILLTLFITSLVAVMAFRTAPVADKNLQSSFPVNYVTKKWVVDKAHSNLKFTVIHLLITEIDGSFKIFDGSMEHSKPDFSDAKIAFTVDVNSINTDNDDRDKHLKSDDFFNAEKYPQMKFESTSFKALNGNKYKLDGNLTIRDISKPVSFDVTYGGSINTQRGAKAGFKATTSINRFDYKLKWDMAIETGGLVVGKEVEITVKLQMNEAK